MNFKSRVVTGSLVAVLVSGAFAGSPAFAASYDAFPDCSAQQNGMTLKVEASAAPGNVVAHVCKIVAEKVTVTKGTKNGKPVTVQNVARTYKVVPSNQTFALTSGTMYGPTRTTINYGGMARYSKLTISLVAGKSHPSCGYYQTRTGTFVAYAGEKPSADVKCVYVGVAQFAPTASQPSGALLTTNEVVVTPAGGRVAY